MYVRAQVARHEETANSQANYIDQLEDYANTVEGANAVLRQQVTRDAPPPPPPGFLSVVDC